MKKYRPLRLVFLVYDFVRLIVAISLLVLFIQPASLRGGGVFPHVFYVVPNGLFPLMSFFLWADPDAYKPFIALYMAGKILAVVSVLAWLMFSLPLIFASFFEGRRATFIVAGAVLLLSVGDALSFFGWAALKKRISDAALPREPGDFLPQGSANPGAAHVPKEGN
jgi:hypothetical protein